MLLIGKPSISMGHLYHGYVSHNQRVIRVYKLTYNWPYLLLVVANHGLFGNITHKNGTNGEIIGSSLDVVILGYGYWLLS